jgi:hypothetical protein
LHQKCMFSCLFPKSSTSSARTQAMVDPVQLFHRLTQVKCGFATSISFQTSDGIYLRSGAMVSRLLHNVFKTGSQKVCDVLASAARAARFRSYLLSTFCPNPSGYQKTHHNF